MVFVIIQARMGSSRLPGKVMLDICNEPILWHVVNRVKHSEHVDKILIATSEEASNDIIRDFCVNNSLMFYSGSEYDVLDRFYQTAKLNDIMNDDIIVRITADCPLIDPEVIDKVIEEFLKTEADYASNVGKPTYPDGLDCEVMRFSILAKAWENAILKSEREHVTLYIRNHPEMFKVINVENKKDLSSLRWTIDEKEDYDLINWIYEKLYKKSSIFLMNDVLDLIAKNPEKSKINSRFFRNEGLIKSLSEDSFGQ